MFGFHTNFKLMRKMMWLSFLGGVAAGGWSLWKLRGAKDEIEAGNWSPVPSMGHTSTENRPSTANRSGGGSTAGAPGGGNPTTTNNTASATQADTPQGVAAATTSTPKSSPTQPSSANKTGSTASATKESTAKNASSTSKKTAPKKTAPKKTAPKKAAPKKAASTKAAPKKTARAGANSSATGNHVWVQPDPKGACPADFPVKANNGSKIFHVPGGGSYKRTKAERCYSTAEAAEADGYRPAKR